MSLRLKSWSSPPRQVDRAHATRAISAVKDGLFGCCEGRPATPNIVCCSRNSRGVVRQANVTRLAVPQWKTCAQRWMTGAKHGPLDTLRTPYSQALKSPEKLGSCGIRN
jgi:hypothetical protein